MWFVAKLGCVCVCTMIENSLVWITNLDNYIDINMEHCVQRLRIIALYGSKLDNNIDINMANLFPDTLWYMYVRKDNLNHKLYETKTVNRRSMSL